MRISDWSSAVCSSDLSHSAIAGRSGSGTWAATSWNRMRSAGASRMIASISAAGRSSSARMKSVIRPDRVRVERRHRPSTVLRRGAALASTSTINRRHQAGRARTSSGFIAPQMKQLDFGGTGRQAASKIGRAHVCTQVTNAQLVCSLLLEKKKEQYIRQTNEYINKYL